MRRRRKQQHNFVTVLLEDVGMQYSLPVMFHAFPVVWRETQQSIARTTDIGHIIEA